MSCICHAEVAKQLQWTAHDVNDSVAIADLFHLKALPILVMSGGDQNGHTATVLADPQGNGTGASTRLMRGARMRIRRSGM